MPYIFHNSEDVVEVGPDWIDRLRQAAKDAPLKRSRLCLHRSNEDPLHEMIICFHRDTVVRPHRHTTKSESFHLIEGELDVIFFNDAGKAVRRLVMDKTKSTLVYRLSAPMWHSVIVRSEYAVIHEITNGPFNAAESDFAPWAPVEEPALAAFLSSADHSLPRA